LWCLYTASNSIVFINFLVYFSKWLVLDAGVSDFAYNMVFVATALALLVTAPALAAHNDKAGNRKKFLNVATLGVMASYLLAAIFAFLDASAPALIFFLAGQYCYQLSFSFYDPMLNDIADEEHRAAASGLSQFASSAGMVLGLAVTLPLAGIGRLWPLIPSVLLFAALAWPMMLYYKEPPRPKASGAIAPKVRIGFDWKKFRNFILSSPAALVLISFFFYNDALATITNNYPIYAGKVLDMSDETTSIMLMTTMLAGSLGALIAGVLGDRLGVRKCLKIILWTWLVLIPVIAAASSMTLFFALAALLGLTIGAGWATSRAYISLCLEKDDLGYGFSFYTIFERFSSIIGPLVWGGILAAGGGHRLAMLSMAGFIAAGIFVLNLTKSAGRYKVGVEENR
jgi:UMF1 family MFS transporter